MISQFSSLSYLIVLRWAGSASSMPTISYLIYQLVMKMSLAKGSWSNGCKPHADFEEELGRLQKKSCWEAA